MKLLDTILDNFMQSSFDVNPNSKEIISPAISNLTFPFHLKGYQLEAVDA